MDKETQPIQPPTNPAPTNPPAAPHAVDIGSILLPKKEAHDPRNAQRADAGALLTQEQTAELPKTPAPPLATPPRNDSIVQPLVTYQSDMQKYIQKNNVSNVTIAAAEAERRGKGESTAPVGQSGSFLLKLGMIFLGSLLVGSAIGIVGYMVYRLQALPAALDPQAPIIAVDEVQEVTIAPSDLHSAAIDKLVRAKDAVKLSLGLVAQIVPLSGTSTTPVPLDSKAFLSVTAPTMPQELRRTILPTFLVGVHSFDANQPFIILKTDSYEQAYSGMLAWETAMFNDLSPLFAAPVLPAPIETPIATTTATTSPMATSTKATATTTQSVTYSTSTIVSQPAAVLQTGFIDKILENHDTRVLQTPQGEVYFLWTFIDRGTILITSNQNTLKEVISRTYEAPILIVPGQ